MLVSSLSPVNAHALVLLAEPVPLVQEVKVNPIYNNCYLFIKSKIPEFPSTKDLKTSDIPHVGGVVILDYNGTPHYAFIPNPITKEGFRVQQTNLKKGEYTEDFLTWEYLKQHDAKYWYYDI